MAVLPDYVTGTITLANGSTTVTGTGTMFATAAFRPGDTLQIQNLTAVIASIDSNTSLTLTEPWTGTSLTNAPYRARYLPDGARVTAQTTTLIELLASGNLLSISELQTSGDKGLYFSGAGVADLFDFRQGARNFLSAFQNSDDGSVIPNSLLPARIKGFTPVVSDLNNAIESGWYRTETTAANAPLATSGTLNVIAQANNVLKQIWYQRDGTRVFMRTNILGTWQAWSETASTATAAALALLNLSGTAAADRLPYLTGASGAGLTVLTAFARTLLDDTTGAAMWATMGAQLNTVGSSGYCLFPNKLLVQWGSEVLPDGVQYGVFALPTSFANSGYILVGICGDAQMNPGVLVGRNLDGLNPGSFSYRKTYQSTGVTVAYRFNYIAVGVAP
ncbi:pyocin knob domain-containing protein [Brucella intermedia]|uniref:pyocin knob domain-containing protein n=1 Tax=Brucella intermedia TaxID=94625 RepID=UPI00200029D5|nr:pyocin knob domain-containing protein [Brucella intermedia]